MPLLYRLYTGLILLLSFVFFATSVSAQNTFFLEDFNEVRPNNTLDINKWNYYPNNNIGVTTIKEGGGVLLLNQQINTNQFPLVTSKNPLPNSDYFVEIKFRYTNVTFWGTGIVLSEKAPVNGSGFDVGFNISIWQDRTLNNLRIGFNGQDIHYMPVNTLDHVIKVERSRDKYLIYLDSQLIYFSNANFGKLNYIWMGNPTFQNPKIPIWTSLNIDYIRVTSSSSYATNPFLDLPWEYESKGLSFSEAALSINSFFDHEYPLLSTNLLEPILANSSIVDFKGLPRKDKPYSKHDGYDWGRKAKASLGEKVLAAASGFASFINSCRACGNMVLIDHQNGYQTRYLHLLKSDLITDLPNQPVWVNQGQQIGLVGSTGNSTGAHIHFGVFQDKNLDGDFEDNIPDGVTDPFGWQTQDPDPWENYFFNYKNKDRQGNSSQYLWNKSIDSTSSILASFSKQFKLAKFNLSFFDNSINKDSLIELNLAPMININKQITSLGTILEAKATDLSGNTVTNFNKNFKIEVDLNMLDLSKIDTSTILIYSSQDGVNWNSFPTTLDLINKKIFAFINHFSYFGAFASRLDIISPQTTLSLLGSKGKANFYKSDVRVELEAIDNIAGLGVDHSFIKITKLDNQEDISDWEIYTNPISITQEGSLKVFYYSVDLDDNIEEIKEEEFIIDKTPPEVLLNTDKLVLWPPNSKFIDINILGSSTDLYLDTTDFELQDEYNLIEPQIYGFGDNIKLEASRLGDDLGGRVYQIKALAKDLAGNSSEGIAEILVPHDLR